MAITSFVKMDLADERRDTVEVARRCFVEAAEIQLCFYVTGGISFVLVVVTARMASYSELTRRLFSDNPVVASFRSLIALDRVKSGTEIVIR